LAESIEFTFEFTESTPIASLLASQLGHGQLNRKLERVYELTCEFDNLGHKVSQRFFICSAKDKNIISIKNM